MSGKLVGGVLVCLMLTVGGWTLAEQATPPAAGSGPVDGGPFAVTPVGEAAILLDTKTGRTWELHFAERGASAWLPVSRIDDDDVAMKWRVEKEDTSRRGPPVDEESP